MGIEIRMAVMSHLSDAQELINLGYCDKASLEIDFAKTLLIKFKDNLNGEISEEDLDILWCESRVKYGKRERGIEC